MRVKISYDIALTGKTHPLYRHFDGQSTEQPAYIDYHTKTGELRAGYSDDIGGGIPSDVWDGTRKRWRISAHLDFYEIRELLDDVANSLAGPGAERYGVDWDHIEYMCEEKTTDGGGVMDATDWMDSGSMIQMFDITAETTDADLDSFVPEIHDLADTEATLLGGRDYLERIRDAVRRDLKDD